MLNRSLWVKNVGLVFILLLFQFQGVFAQKTSVKTINVSNVVAIDFLSKEFYILSNSNTGKLYRIDKQLLNPIIVVSEGGGPKEAKYVNGFTSSSTDNTTYLIKDSGVLMQFDTAGFLLEDKSLGFFDQITNFTPPRSGEFIYSRKVLVNPNDTESDLTVIKHANLKTKTTKSLFALNFDDLKIKQPGRLVNLRYANFSSNLVERGDNIYFILNGHPMLYILNKKTSSVSEFDFSTFFPQSYPLLFEVQNHPQYGYGFKTPPVFTSLHIHKDKLYIGNGNVSVGATPLLFEVDLSSDKALFFRLKMKDFGVNAPKFFSYGDSLFVYEAFEQVANGVFVFSFSGMTESRVKIE